MASQKKPNILIIWGDDIGWFNVSAYNMGIMGTGRPTSIASRSQRRLIRAAIRPTACTRRAIRPMPMALRGIQNALRRCTVQNAATLPIA